MYQLATVLVLLAALGVTAVAQVTLVPTGSTWRYLDSGNDLGSTWRGSGFSDASWDSGPAELGYGDDDEATLLDFGPNPDLKFTTYYFRHTFNVGDASSITNLKARLLRDDGAVVYLNGVEAFRQNMPTGEVTFATFAPGAVANLDESTFFDSSINPALLMTGANLLAVEIHQTATNSSDISFDLQLIGNPQPQIAFSSPTNGQVLTAVNIPLNITATPGGESIVRVDFFANGLPIGSATTAPFGLLWQNVTPASYSLTATLTDSSGLTATSVPVSITVEDIPSSTLVNRSDVWKYNNLNTDLGTAWRAPGFDDASWASGAAPLGNGLLNTGEIPFGTAIDIGPNGGRYPTIYFRRNFVVEDPSDYVGLVINLLRDDGAAIYLNGQEMVRDGIASGAGFATFAAIVVANTDEITYFPHVVSASALVAGNNVIAVEVKNTGTTSSDLGFDMDMAGDLVPIVTLTSPSSGQVFNPSTPILIVAEALDDGGIDSVQFYDGLDFIGQDLTPPYSFTWSNVVDGAHVLTAVATDSTGNSATSAAVNISVVDPNPPALSSATGTTNTLNVIFSKRITEASATNIANYAILGPGGAVAILGASLENPGNRVVLSTGPMVEGQNYTLTVNGVQDLAEQFIAPNSQIQFIIQQFLLVDVGNPAPAGSQSVVPGGFNITGSGTNLLGNRDQFTFSYLERVDDFDLKVRVSSMSLADSWAKSGLMARESLNANARFVGSIATPSVAGSFFESRGVVGSGTVIEGSFPVNYPYTWLRLRRVGDEFTGWASLDGQNWRQLGQVTLPGAARPMLVGLAVATGVPGATVTSGFRDFSESLGEPVGRVVLQREPLGPSSRRTPLAISEVMYHQKNFPGITGSLEFIEIYNGQEFFEDLSGFQIDGDVHYTFPQGTLLNAGEFLVVARDPATLQATYGISGVLGPWRMQTNITATATNIVTENLPNNQGTVRLENELGGHILEVNYDSDGAWPVEADGAGHSLVLAHPSNGEGNVEAWAASELIGGSPGRQEALVYDPLTAVVINEFLAHTDLPQVDFIELFNTSTLPINIGGCYLTDDVDTNKFRIPDNTMLPARGFLVFTEVQLGFRLNTEGEDILLVNPGELRVLDAVRFQGQENGVSHGRYPDGQPGFQDLAGITAGSPNTPPLERDIVINEIMYRPISDDSDEEFVEIYNRGAAPVDLSLWSFEDGIAFTFPVGTSIHPGAYLVVAKNRTNLLARYPNLASTPGLVLGNFDGQLANSGETVTLSMPDINLTTNGVTVLTNLFYIVVDEVSYKDGGRWGQWSDGGGSSLELVDPFADNRLAANWADSDETQKAPWTLVERTGPLELGMTAGNGTPNRFEFYIEGPGECLVDEMECRQNGGANLLGNPGFESGTSGWAFQGTHARSSVQVGGAFAGSSALRLRAVERGDAGANRIRRGITTLTTGAGNTATLRARARWLMGDTNILLRIRGQWMQAVGGMTLPTNLGSPGAANSRLVPNTGPAIYDVVHTPILPGANESVLVTARVHDPDGLAGLVLRYRLDPSASLASVGMRDDGLGGDITAGDGMWSGTLPGQSSGTLVAFHLVATDAHVPAANKTFPSDAPSRECHVRFGESLRPGSIANYRLWVTAANLSTWNAREKNSNEPFDATFVYGDWRVVYNAETLYSGSPFHTPEYNGPLGSIICDYEVGFPKDDQFLGATDFVLNGQNATQTFFQNDVSAQAESTAYWMGRKIGLGWNHKRHVFVFLNGQQRGMVYFDHVQPSGIVLDTYFPSDTGGRLHKIEDWFEFDDGGAGFNYITALLTDYRLTNGERRPERYRFTFRPRSGTHPNDFEDLLALVDAANASSPEPYIDAIEGLIDVRNWMRVLALQHTIGNWDSYGYRRGKNMYTYKPTEGPWELLLWDLDLVLGKGSDGTGQNLFDTGGEGDSLIAKMMATPPFRREYWCALKDLVEGPMQPSNYNPLSNAKYAAFQANGMPADSPAAMKAWIDARRNYILSQIPSANFTISNPTSFVSASNYVVLSGTAPVDVKDILINGIPYSIVWTSETAWELRVPLLAGLNVLQIQAVDRFGNVLSSQVRNVTFSGADVDPEGHLVFNEVMFNPPKSGGGFVELRNTHPSHAFDLSGWRVNGMDYTFPAGSAIGPDSLLVLTENRGEYAKVFGGAAVAFGQIDGRIDVDGETFTLLRPGAMPGEGIVVDKLKYEARPPWAATQVGSRKASIQLIDPARDNARVSNWGLGSDWKFFSTNGTPNGLRLLFYLDTAGSVFIDDMRLEEGLVPGAGVNRLLNGDFESPFATGWQVNGVNGLGSTVSTAEAFNGNSSLLLDFDPAGSPFQYVFQDINPAGFSPTVVHTLSFWYLPSADADNFIYRISSLLRGTELVRSTAPSGLPIASPDRPNNIGGILPAYPLVWLNEVRPVNSGGFLDNQGEAEPWIELYNSSAVPISLEGLFLSDNYLDLDHWAFPAGAMLAPGEFKIVVADGEPGESTGTQWHTSFALSPASRNLALSRMVGGSPHIVDYLNVDALLADESYGSLPDGQLFDRQRFFFPTPGGPNDGSAPTVVVWINEWMASNTGFILDPADSDDDDWFEIYNPGPEPVDMGGFYLTDNLGNPFKYQIPDIGHYIIPARGYLLVWADDETGQNNTDSLDLHAGFRLGASGEAIGIFAQDGTPIDMLTFGSQTENLSEGRFPDGAVNRIFMTTPTPRAANVSDDQPESPLITSVLVQPNGIVSFAFQSDVGRTYRVQYKDDLNSPTWLLLSGPFPGNGNVITIEDDNLGSPQRFYQVVVE